MQNSKNYNVVGVTFDNKQEILNKFYKNYKYGSYYPVKLEKEDNNPYDKNAVAVLLDVDGYQKVGFISKNENIEIRNLMDKIKDVKVATVGVSKNGNIGLNIIVIFEDKGEEK